MAERPDGAVADRIERQRNRFVVGDVYWLPESPSFKQPDSQRHIYQYDVQVPSVKSLLDPRYPVQPDTEADKHLALADRAGAGWPARWPWGDVLAGGQGCGERQWGEEGGAV